MLGQVPAVQAKERGARVLLAGGGTGATSAKASADKKRYAMKIFTGEIPQLFHQ